MKALKIFFYIFALWLGVGVLSTALFILTYHTTINAEGAFNYFLAIWHGIRLDLSIAGYLTLLPGILLIVSKWWRGKSLYYIWMIYFIITSSLYFIAVITNIGLYQYWGFPLDNTSLLYIKTSPVDAMASLTLWQMLLFPSVVLILTILFCIVVKAISHIYFTYSPTKNHFASKISYSVTLLLLTALLILPIRGGVGTGTNHTGSVYFSTNIQLNHCAVNPLFSFVESVTHEKEDFSKKYRFFSDVEANKLFTGMINTQMRKDTAFTETTSIPNGTNVVIICLESFSKYIMEEAGNVKGVTPNLDKLTQEGIYFTNFYANSFRTDRALVSVLSGMPAQPTMSIVDIPNKSTKLPSIASTLAKNNYDTHFYYGGDINFSNLRSYLMGTGFQHITCDENFSRNELAGKWGAHDETVYTRMLSDIKTYKSTGKPFFKFIMTESSHEPYDVPYKSKFGKELNSFAYADKCLGDFIKAFKQLACWNNTLVVIVPDHLGVYPQNIDNYQLWRYEIPLILTGGAIPDDCHQKNNTIGSQIDIVATVLGLLNIDHKDFIFSKDLFDKQANHFAFFTFPDAMGYITDCDTLIHDNHAEKLVLEKGTDTANSLKQAKAYLQKLYDYIADR